MQLKIILIGSTGLVGEGVLLECLAHPQVSEVLMINRSNNIRKHPKLKELIVPDFLQIESFAEELKEYDACFYCAGISSVGISEDAYTKVTYTTTLHVAEILEKINKNMVFSFVSGSRTDSSENGKVMWARVKGRTENALQKLGFKAQYNFRPGFMKPTTGQHNVRFIYRVFESLYPVWITFLPNWTCKMSDVGLAMINSVLKGYPKQVLEVKDIKALAKE